MNYEKEGTDNNIINIHRKEKNDFTQKMINEIDNQLSEDKERLINSISFNQSHEEIDKLAKNIKFDIKNLSKIIKAIIDKHHRDYISTFSSFMDSVRKDLKLKLEQMEKTEQEKRKVNDIKYIKCERDYFRIESIRMHQLTKDLTGKIEDMSLRMKILTDEVNNVTLKWRESETINKQMAKELEENVQAQKDIQHEMIQMKEFIQKNAEEKYNYELCRRKEEEKEENFKERSLPLVEKLKAELRKEKMRNHKLFSELTNILKEKNKLENIFIDCVEETRKNILNRRLKEKFTNKLGKSNSMRNLMFVDTKYESFLPSDKRNILENFIFNDEVSSIIRDALVIKSQKTTENQLNNKKIMNKITLPEPESSRQLKNNVLKGFTYQKKGNYQMINYFNGKQHNSFSLPRTINH